MKKIRAILFFILLLLLCFVISANVTHFDFDLWARLIAGMGFVDGGQVLKQDFLSYTPTHTWWDHEYGSGVVFYSFLKHFGPYSLIVLQTILIFLMFVVITQITKLRGCVKRYNLLFYILPLVALSANFGSPIRCHIFSFFFFSIFLYILELSRKDNYKLIYVLPLLTVLWNNLHGGVVSGIGLMVLYAVGAILDKKTFKHYLIVAALSFILLIINPWGWEYIKFLLMANTMARTHVAEWWGLFSKFHLFRQIPFKIFMFLIVVIEFWTLKSHFVDLKNLWSKIDKTKYLILCTTLFLAILHVKLLPFFIITACAFCYEDFEECIADKIPNLAELSAAIFILLMCIFSFIVKKYDIPLGIAVYPHKEVEFIKINNLKGNLLVNFGLGSFVSYKLYPQNLIFMDGRYEEVYYDDMVPLLDKFYTLKDGWDEVLKKYPPDIMIIEKYYPVYNLLNTVQDWSNVYEAETFAVFVRTENLKKSYIMPSTNIQYYKDTLFDTSIKF